MQWQSRVGVDHSAGKGQPKFPQEGPAAASGEEVQELFLLCSTLPEARSGSGERFPPSRSTNLAGPMFGLCMPLHAVFAVRPGMTET